MAYILNIRAREKFTFQIPNIKKTFNYLWLIFIKALIFQHFDLKSHIRIEIYTLCYAIGRVLSLLNLDFDVLSNNSNLNKSDFG